MRGVGQTFGGGGDAPNYFTALGRQHVDVLEV